ncbi:MAG: penicillin acylase family protein [Pseudomonadota bacterium]
MRRILGGLVVIVGVSLTVLIVWVKQANDYQTDGILVLSALSAPVTVTRDSRGVAHIAASNRRDMLRAQGFITAQDRLFQMEFFRMLAWGRLSELIGEAGLSSDTEMRVLGLPENARRMAIQFAPDVREFLEDYLTGVNAYIATREDEFPLELSLLGHTPQPWSLEDSAIVLQFISLQHSVNMKAEALSLALIDRVGPERAASLMPINVNVDRTAPAEAAAFHNPMNPSSARPSALNEQASTVVPETLADVFAPLHFGSNNWVTGPTRSENGAAIVVNDPHLDSRLLPGVWYPVGMSTPDFHAAGVALPAIPGLVVGRTNRVAYGVTNAYGDVQDLFLERPDPLSEDHYLEGEERVPFDVRIEAIRVRDEDADGGYRIESIAVRSTKRGPIVSDHGIVNLGGRTISLKWGASVAYGPEIGYDKLFFAQSAAEVDAAVQLIDINMFNVVFADVDGNFGRRSTGKIPNRRVGQGVIPVAVTDGEPYWTSWIPKDEMPGESNPERGWSGTANHDTRPDNYPYTYSTFFSPSYRYRRLGELMESKDQFSAADHWTFMHDVRNLQAAAMVPQLTPILRSSGHEDFAAALEDWSFDDTIDGRAPLVYQTLYRQLVIKTFADELGDELVKEYLGNWYYWQERFDALFADEDALWFDDVTTEERERRANVVSAAADAATLELANLDAPQAWGDVHTLTFSSPLRQSGFGAKLVGAGTHPISGSGDTLRRARYGFNQPFETAFFASYNMVSDMSRSDYIETALPGGVAARMFHEHYGDQIETWLSGAGSQTPLSLEAAKASAISSLQLVP